MVVVVVIINRRRRRRIRHQTTTKKIGLGSYPMLLLFALFLLFEYRKKKKENIYPYGRQSELDPFVQLI